MIKYLSDEYFNIENGEDRQERIKTINSRAKNQELIRTDKALWAQFENFEGQMNNHSKDHSWKPTFKSPQSTLVVETWMLVFTNDLLYDDSFGYQILLIELIMLSPFLLTLNSQLCYW